MDSRQATVPDERQPWLAHALLEAGSESWEAIQDVLQRCMEELSAQDVLEIVSHRPDIQAPLLVWSQEAGHAIVRAEETGQRLSLWLRKTLEDLPTDEVTPLAAIIP